MAAGYRGKITLPQHVPHTLNTLDGNWVRELWTTPSHLCKVLHCFIHACIEVSHGLRVGLTFVVAPVCRLLLCMFVQTLDCRTRSQFSCGSVGGLREQVLSWLQNGRWGGKLVSFRSTPVHSLGRPEFDRSSLGVRTVQAKPAQQPGESDSLAVTTWVVFAQWGPSRAPSTGLECQGSRASHLDIGVQLGWEGCHSQAMSQDSGSGWPPFFGATSLVLGGPGLHARTSARAAPPSTDSFCRCHDAGPEEVEAEVEAEVG